MPKRVLVIVLTLVIVGALAVAGLLLAPALLDAEPEGSGHVVGDSGAETMEDEDLGTLEIYSVLDDASLDPAPSGLTERVWQTFVRIVTPEFAIENVVEFRVGDDSESDLLAWVEQTEDTQHWVLAANLATSEDESELVATLVHEFAHILSLSSGEMDVEAANCDTIELSEGCAVADSMLWRFDQAFWSGYDDAPAPDNGDDDEAYAFYEEHEDDFVSDYAATNVVEDLAESFAAFVLEDEPDSDTVVAEKLRFFWQVDELVELRKGIRTEFADDLGF